jgi:hypothetical protein
MNFDKGEAVNAGQVFCGDCAHGLIFTQRREVRKDFYLTAEAQRCKEIKMLDSIYDRCNLK